MCLILHLFCVSFGESRLLDSAVNEVERRNGHLAHIVTRKELSAWSTWFSRMIEILPFKSFGGPVSSKAGYLEIISQSTPLISFQFLQRQ